MTPPAAGGACVARNAFAGRKPLGFILRPARAARTDGSKLHHRLKRYSSAERSPHNSFPLLYWRSW